MHGKLLYAFLRTVLKKCDHLLQQLQSFVSALLQCLWHSAVAAVTAHCCFRLNPIVTLLRYNV